MVAAFVASLFVTPNTETGRYRDDDEKEADASDHSIENKVGLHLSKGLKTQYWVGERQEWFDMETALLVCEDGWLQTDYEMSQQKS